MVELLMSCESDFEMLDIGGIERLSLELADDGEEVVEGADGL